MKVIIITCVHNYPYHKVMADNVKQAMENLGMQVSEMDVFDEAQHPEQMKELQRDCGSLVVTFDFAGFEALTEMNSLFYNTLPVKMVHFIWKQQQEYPLGLSGRINFSMFFYSSNEVVLNEMKEKYPHMKNCRTLTGLDCLVSQSADTDAVRKIITEILKDME